MKNVALNMNEAGNVLPVAIESPDEISSENVSTELEVSQTNTSISGHVDIISHESISGWAADPLQPDRRVIVSVWVSDRCISMTQTGLPRPDVKEAGFGNGNSGFELDLTPIKTINNLSSELKFELWASINGGRTLLHQGQLQYLFDHWGPACTDLIAITFHQYMMDVTSDCDAEQTLIYSPSESDQADISEKLYRPHDENACVQSTETVPTISAYTRFTRDRLNQHRIFDYDQDPRAAVDLLLWYIEAYGSSRAPLKIPLSKAEISFCNQMIIIPGTRYSLTQLHYYYYLRQKPTANLLELLNNESAYCEELIEWTTITCRRLNIEDIGSPKEYLDFLRIIDWNWKGKQFPLNRYFTHLFQSKAEWHCFDVQHDTHRGVLYMLALLDGINNYTHVHLMPEEVKRELTSTNQFIQHVCMSLFEPVFGTTLNMNLFVDWLESNYLKVGYALSRSEYTSLNRSGNRHEFSNLKPKISNQEIYDIQLIGPLAKASGLGQATRLSARMIMSLNIDHNFVNFDLDNPAPDGFGATVASGRIAKAKINLIHLNAESVPFAIAYAPDVFSESYNIGYFFWELDSPALCHQLALDLLDEVWVCSEYGISQYNKNTNKPVVNVGMSVQELDIPDKTKARQYLSSKFGIQDNTKVFLTTFDSFSFVQRKNPLGVIRAFKLAFGNNEDVCLLIKTQNKSFVGDPAQLKVWRAIEYAIAGDSRIRLINETLEYKELLTFKKSVDCYISLHRSEGWGFGMIEAMSMGVPVIATNYSANLEYCTAENSWLVDADEQYLAESDYIFVQPGQKWVEPDTKHASTLLRDIYENPIQAEKRAKRAREEITTEFSESTIAQNYRSRIDHLLSKRKTSPA